MTIGGFNGVIITECNGLSSFCHTLAVDGCLPYALRRQRSLARHVTLSPPAPSVIPDMPRHEAQAHPHGVGIST